MKRILYIHFLDPAMYPPLEQSSQVLADHGWEILILGRRIHPDRTFDLAPHPNIRLLRLGYVPLGWRTRLMYVLFMAWVIWWAIRFRPRFLYASDALTTPVAWFIQRLGLALVIYHEHDFVFDQGSKLEDVATPSRFLRIVLHFRSRLLHQVQLCVIPNEKRAAFVQQTTKTERPIQVVWNCPRIGEIPPLHQRSTRKDAPFTIWYHGSIVPFRIPIAIIQALKNLPRNSKLIIGGYETSGDIGYISFLKQEAFRLDIADRVLFKGTTPRRDHLILESQVADIGLAFSSDSFSMNTSPEWFFGASNKIFDYMAAGVIPLVNEDSFYKKTLVDPGYALMCNPHLVSSVSETLHWCITHRKILHEMNVIGREKVLNSWNYEVQFGPTLKLLESTLN